MIEKKYPKASIPAGRLIRKVIEQFQAARFSKPVIEPMALAVSGGVDSMVMAHLFGKYGRKIVNPSAVTLVHFDHGWRAESANDERQGVVRLAKEFGYSFLPVDLTESAKPPTRVNLELFARRLRKQWFLKSSGPGKSFRWIGTAHHRDDRVETLVWRFARGEYLNQPWGILFRDGPIIRPMLRCPKSLLLEYAKVENVEFFEDSTNSDSRRMRTRLRTEILPTLEKTFPNLRRQLAQAAEAIPEPAVDRSSGDTLF